MFLCKCMVWCSCSECGLFFLVVSMLCELACPRLLVSTSEGRWRLICMVRVADNEPKLAVMSQSWYLFMLGISFFLSIFLQLFEYLLCSPKLGTKPRKHSKKFCKMFLKWSVCSVIGMCVRGKQWEGNAVRGMILASRSGCVCQPLVQESRCH